MLVATLLDRAMKGRSEAISLAELAAAMDVTTADLRSELERLSFEGVIAKDGLLAWDEVSSVSLGMPTINVMLLQGSLPQVNEQARGEPAHDFGDKLDLLIEQDRISFECGWADGERFWWRVGCVADQESDCVVLSAMRELWNSETAPLEPAHVDDDGTVWVPLVEARKFGPSEFGEAGAREEALAWLREMLEGFDPDDEQRAFHGLKPAPVAHALSDIDPLHHESPEIPESIDDETEAEAKPKGRRKKAS